MSEQPYTTGLSGNPACPHDALRYYHSSMHVWEEYDKEGNVTFESSGNYALCQKCGAHIWEVGVLPEGTEVVDLDTFEDDEPEDEA